MALNKVSFSIDKAEIVGLIGPNGSGKTTLLNIISGFYRADGGEIHFAGNGLIVFPLMKYLEEAWGGLFRLLKLFID